MFIDGDGGSSPVEPTFSGPQTLNVEPSAIPAALAAFTKAHDRLTKKVDELTGLQIRPWAGDEVSHETATRFGERSQGGGADSAIACLKGYQEQLAAACTALADSQERYLRTEGENAALWGKY